jgi:hypothetical protein
MELNLKLLLLGAVPPALAVLAELFNVVRGADAIMHTKDEVSALITDRGQGEKATDTERHRAGELIARTVDGAVEVAGIVPTWISVTAGVAGITSEAFSLTTAATVTAIIAACLAVMLPYAFRQLDYYRLAEGMRCRILFADNQRECLSHALIAANLIVIVLAMLAAYVVAPTHAESLGH